MVLTLAFEESIVIRFVNRSSNGETAACSSYWHSHINCNTFQNIIVSCAHLIASKKLLKVHVSSQSFVPLSHRMLMNCQIKSIFGNHKFYVLKHSVIFKTSPNIKTKIALFLLLLNCSIAMIESIMQTLL